MKPYARVFIRLCTPPFVVYCGLTHQWIGVVGLVWGMVVDALFWYSEGKLDG